MLRANAPLTSYKWNGIENIKRTKNIIKRKKAAKNFIIFCSGCFLLCFLGCNSHKVTQQPVSQPPPPESSAPLQSEKQPDAAEVTIEGIVYDQRHPLVVINGQLLSLQDEIEGVRIVEISPTAVTLQDTRTDKRIVKELPKAEIAPQSSSEKTKDSADSSKKSSIFAQARTIETSQVVIYLPGKISSTQKYPLLVVLLSDDAATASVNYLQEICEKYKWIMLVSKKFHAGVDMRPVISDLALSVKSLSNDYPIDNKRVVVTGFSAGAMGAHFFSWAHTDVVSAIIVNTGVINEALREAKRPYPNQKYAVFLASPTDFRYQQMQEDRRFLEQSGWQVKWIEFKGGHALAPQAAYEEAIQWLRMKL